MNIHLLRSPELELEKYENVLEIVGKYSTPLRFIPADSGLAFSSNEIESKELEKGRFTKKDKLSELYLEASDSVFLYKSLANWRPDEPISQEFVSWESIFEKCNHFRKMKDIGKDEKVMLLTDYANDKNWFSAWDPSGNNNSFIHTGNWEFYVPSDARFPVAYEVLVTTLQSILFDSYEDAHFHKKPRGCINDFWKDKKDVILKLRTADICPNCQELLYKKKIDHRITGQVFRTLDDIRSHMLFRERYKSTLQPSRMEIRGMYRHIFFTDLGNVQLRLNPLETLVYLLFLEHPEGLRYTEVSDHREWLISTYKEIGNVRTLPEILNSVDQLCNVLDNSLSEKISRIKRKIISLVGEDLAQHYIIDGPRDERKRIGVDRGLVSYPK